MLWRFWDRIGGFGVLLHLRFLCMSAQQGIGSEDLLDTEGDKRRDPDKRFRAQANSQPAIPSSFHVHGPITAIAEQK